MLCRFLLACACGWMLVATAEADVVTVNFDPAAGTFNDMVEPCGGCATGFVTRYTENGVMVQSFNNSIHNLLITIEPQNVPGLVSASYPQFTFISLVDGSPFQLDSVDIVGFNAVLEGYNGSTGTAGLANFIGYAHLDLTGDPAWSHLTSLEFSADSGVAEPPETEITNLVINRLASPVPEPSTLLLTATLCGIWLGACPRNPQD